MKEAISSSEMTLEEVIAHNNQRAKALEKLGFPRYNERKKSANFGRDGATGVHWFDGKPLGTEEIDPTGKTFRHLTTEENFNAILESGVLKAGQLPYARGGSYYDFFIHLQGVFVTTQEPNLREVGVDLVFRTHYVDVQFPKGIRIFQITPDIFLIPVMPGVKVPIEITGSGKMSR